MLKEFVAKGRKANAQLRGRPAKPEKMESTTIHGELAIIDELHCGCRLSANTIHGGQVDEATTHDSRGRKRRCGTGSVRSSRPSRLAHR